MKRVALYLRISKEDIDKDSKEEISRSIKNQELMLKEEVQKHPDWQITNIYCDEDFSGAGTYRPEFDRMIKSCSQKEIDIILCKSQSRFSREMEIIEKYIHNKFIEWNVRFISIVDNIDTDNKGNKKMRQINALVNEWFLEDLSENIKATLKSKWQKGESTAAFAKYGFLKDPKNKNHLIIDPLASSILKQIGNYIIQGYSFKKIADILDQKQIPSPYEYKLSNGSKLKLPIKKNLNFISKKGTYIIKVYFFNQYKQILKNIKTTYKFNNYRNLDIKAKYIPEDTKLYCYNKPEKEIKCYETIPQDCAHLFSITKKLDRLSEFNLELEVNLKENKNNDKYSLLIESESNNLSLYLDYEIRPKYRWNAKSIANMMKDPIYNGTLIQGKTKRISYKNHKCVQSSKEDWIISKNALEKIFDDKTWKAIQNKINNKSKAGKNGQKHIFSNKVFCAICGNIMHKNSNSNNYYYLICKDKQNKWLNCSNRKSIRLDVLEENILNALNNLIKDFNKAKEYKKINSLNYEIVNEFIEKIEIDNIKNEIIITWNFT